jgi:hypothetical protein
LIARYLDHALDEIRFLREELGIRNEELRRKDHIIAALTERIPELEPPRERREAPVTATEGEASATSTTEDTGQPRASWWRRMFGTQ